MALSLVACGGENGDGDEPDAAANGGPDAGDTVADAAGGAADAAADATPPDAEPEPCTTLANTAAVIDVVRSAAARPTPVGGTIQDGTYHLIEMVFYNHPMPGVIGTTQSTARITGSALEQVVVRGSNPPETQTDTFVASSATQLQITQTCPLEGEQPVVRDFTASGATLELHTTIVAGDNTIYLVQTWERQ
jgi:hypothetical protein